MRFGYQGHDSVLVVMRLSLVVCRPTARQIAALKLVRQFISFHSKHDENTSGIYDNDWLIVTSSPIWPLFESRIGQES